MAVSFFACLVDPNDLHKKSLEKVRDVVGLYLNPPNRALVLCVEEKSPIQALDRSQPLLPMRPGQAERRAHNHVRPGTTSLFAALDANSGRGISPTQRTLETGY